MDGRAGGVEAMGGSKRWRSRAVLAVRRRGWEVRHLDPFLRIEDYLPRVLFPYHGIDCVLDVGAHTGEYGQALREAGYQGDLVSFEPVRVSFDRLVQRAADDPRWHVHQLALGACDETRAINVTRTTTFSSLRPPRHDVVEEFVAHGNVVDHREEITVRRLDGLFDEVTAGLSATAVYLKMDTQGWDLDVIAGARGVLDRVLALQSELSVLPIYDEMPGFETALHTLTDLGFEMSAMFPVSRDRHLRLVELDCVMTRVAASVTPRT